MYVLLVHWNLCSEYGSLTPTNHFLVKHAKLSVRDLGHTKLIIILKNRQGWQVNELMNIVMRVIIKTPQKVTLAKHYYVLLEFIFWHYAKIHV